MFEKKKIPHFFFSDEYEPLLTKMARLNIYVHMEDRYLLKQLRRGDFLPELF